MAYEKRLIDANELLAKHTCDVYGAYDDSCMVQAVFVPYIKGAPTVDAVEVAHGCWLEIEYDPQWRCVEATCSNCRVRGEVRAQSNTCGFVVPDSLYCPNCGAKMDREENKNDENA